MSRCRSIPSVIDGLKVSQRKVLFSAFKRNLTSDVKVAQFAGYAAEHSAYHHGEASLTATIVGMAQDFVGSNNVNLLVPSGQFGTRLMGGKDAASARYIFTRLAPAARKVFHPDDDPVLDYLVDDGDAIEPRAYVPIVPMVLVNGAVGIGTGWSTSVPQYDPMDVIANVRALVEGRSTSPMVPWYRGFGGTIEEVSPGVYATQGTWSVSGNRVSITELPIGTWTQDAKEHLDGLLEKGTITDYNEHHTDATVHFDVTFPGPVEAERVVDLCKLRTLVRTTNMHLFDANGTIRKYESPEDIVQAHFAVRRDTYAQRKTHVLARLRAAETEARNKARFVREVASGELAVAGRPRRDIEADLETRSYDNIDGFGYLLGMAIHSLTMERSTELEAHAACLANQLADVEGTTPEAMWLRDLAELEAELKPDRPAKKPRHCVDISM